MNCILGKRMKIGFRSDMQWIGSQEFLLSLGSRRQRPNDDCEKRRVPERPVIDHSKKLSQNKRCRENAAVAFFGGEIRTNVRPFFGQYDQGSCGTFVRDTWNKWSKWTSPIQKGTKFVSWLLNIPPSPPICNSKFHETMSHWTGDWIA